MIEEDLEAPDDGHNATAEEDNELQANTAHTAPVQGSDSGRAQGEATSETTQEIKPKTL
jgi:hypothetical protein